MNTLRPRGPGIEQPITTVELFFDLDYAAVLVLLAPLGPHLSALALSATVAALLSALALWELRTREVPGVRLGTHTDATGALGRDLGIRQHQQEGTS